MVKTLTNGGNKYQKYNDRKLLMTALCDATFSMYLKGRCIGVSKKFESILQQLEDQGKLLVVKIDESYISQVCNGYFERSLEKNVSMMQFMS